MRGCAVTDALVLSRPARNFGNAVVVRIRAHWDEHWHGPWGACGHHSNIPTAVTHADSPGHMRAGALINFKTFSLPYHVKT